jgi:Cdc6-like AAA superfamily ATPase
LVKEGDTVSTSQPDVGRLTGLAQAFSPSAPVDQQALFAGRLEQLMRVLNAVTQKGQHAILFGERGVGKTSLARVIAQMGPHHGWQTAQVNCDPTMTFSSLWHKVLREITFVTQKTLPGFTGGSATSVTNLAGALGDQVTPDDVRHLFARLPKTLIVLDELDRLEDPSVSGLLADTIKGLSDHAVDATLLLVGVADSVDSLIAEHQSVERALVQVRMPRMSRTELFEIIDKGLQKVGMIIEPAARDRIADLSQGLPHYTHLLALNASQRAALQGRVEVLVTDVRSAIDAALSNAQQSIISSYHKATASPRENLYPQVLLACALAKQDSLGYFAAVDVRSPLSLIMGREYDIPAFSQHLNAFCELSRGPVLQRSGTPRRFRFRFVNPLMQPFVVMDGIKVGRISEAALKTV